jgi:hypothetical protein
LTLSAGYTLSISSNEDDGPAVSVEMSLRDGKPVVAGVTVVPASDGGLLPIELAAAVDVPALLQAVLTAMTPGALADSRPATTPDNVKASAAPRPNPTPKKRKDAPPEDLGAVYWRLGSITKVANHYGVEKHTARNWINRLTNRTNALSKRGFH